MRRQHGWESSRRWQVSAFFFAHTMPRPTQRRWPAALHTEHCSCWHSLHSPSQHQPVAASAYMHARAHQSAGTSARCQHCMRTASTSLSCSHWCAAASTAPSNMRVCRHPHVRTYRAVLTRQAGRLCRRLLLPGFTAAGGCAAHAHDQPRCYCAAMRHTRRPACRVRRAARALAPRHRATRCCRRARSAAAPPARKPTTARMRLLPCSVRRSPCMHLPPTPPPPLSPWHQ